VTIYRVREVFEDFSLVELELKTGRTHQIRVHLQFLGYPIVNDIIYGGEPVGEPEISEPAAAAGSQPFATFARTKEEGVKIWDALMQRDDLLLQRPALHAAVLQFEHPATGERMTFTAPFHADMSRLIHRLREQRPKSGPLTAEGAVVDLHRLIRAPS